MSGDVDTDELRALLDEALGWIEDNIPRDEHGRSCALPGDTDLIRRLRAALSASPAEPEPPAVPFDQHDREMCEVIAERDRAEEWADKLSWAIAPIEVIGEHSSMNNPWQNALDHAGASPAEPVERDECERERLESLYARMTEKVPILRAMAEAVEPIAGERSMTQVGLERSRLNGKAEGMGVAASYVDEAIRALPALAARPVPVPAAPNEVLVTGADDGHGWLLGEDAVRAITGHPTPAVPAAPTDEPPTTEVAASSPYSRGEFPYPACQNADACINAGQCFDRPGCESEPPSGPTYTYGPTAAECAEHTQAGGRVEFYLNSIGWRLTLRSAGSFGAPGGLRGFTYRLVHPPAPAAPEPDKGEKP